MSMNRLDRDTILKRGLDLVDSAALDNHDRPSATIVSTAYSIGWLQEAIDFFHKRFPFSADITTSSFSLAINDTSFAVPADFVLDYKDGVIITSPDEYRMRRRGLGALLNVKPSLTGQPVRYSVRGSTIQVAPKADKAYTGTLYYYKLPAALGATDVPLFPDDFVLVQYVWLKGKEWHGAIPPGSALKYADDRILELQKSGIGNEAEDDQIEIDAAYAGENTQEAYDWMGKVGV